MSIAKYEAYLFDWDGTLVRSLEVWVQVITQALHETGGAATQKNAVACFGRLAGGALDAGVPKGRLSAFEQAVQRRSHELMADAPMYQYAREMLDSLKAHDKKLALITTGWRSTVDMLLAHHHVSETFDIVITGEDVHSHKPDPEGILRAVDRLGVRLEDVVMFGDSDKDLLAAANAGVDSVLYYPASHEVFYDLGWLQGMRPKYTYTTWREVVRALDTR